MSVGKQHPHPDLTRRPRRRGLTLPELILGMAITVVCLGAMSSMMMAVSTGWKQQGGSQSTYLSNRQAVVRVQSLVRGAKLIGLVREGSTSASSSDRACLMIWKGDTSGGVADRKIQVSEVALLEHDRSKKEIRYYTVSFPASMTPAQIAAADVTLSYSDLTVSNAPENFKSIQYVSGRAAAHDVIGAAFYVSQPLGQSSQLPTFEFQLNVKRKTETSQVYGSVSLRNPDYKPAL